MLVLAWVFSSFIFSHLGLDLLQQCLQLVHVCLLLRPLDTQSLLLIWLGDNVEVDMIDFLVGQTAVVLQDVVVFVALRGCNLLGYGEQFREGVVWNVGDFRAVVLGDYEL